MHGSEEVWFWHRAFLLHFENRLRATDSPNSSNITLPYWDWTEIPSGASGFPAAYERSGSPLNHDRLDHSSTSHSLSPLAVVRDEKTTQAAADYLEALLEEDDWGKFGGTIQGPSGLKGDLESGTHDLIHGQYIGKDNKSPKLSVRDPVFWAHHANLDRLVDTWQTRHPKSIQCLECNSLAYDRDMQAGPFTVQEVLSNKSIRGIQIIYQPRKKISAPPMTLSVADSGPSPEKATLTSVYRIALPAASGELTLIVPNIKVNSQNNYRGDVYLFPENVEFKPDRAFKDRYRIAVLGTFAEAHGEERAYVGNRGPTNEIRTAISLREAIRRLPVTETGKTYTVVIQFVATNEETVTSLASKLAPDISHGPLALIMTDSAGTHSLSIESAGGAK